METGKSLQRAIGWMQCDAFWGFVENVKLPNGKRKDASKSTVGKAAALVGRAVRGDRLDPQLLSRLLRTDSDQLDRRTIEELQVMRAFLGITLGLQGERLSDEVAQLSITEIQQSLGWTYRLWVAATPADQELPSRSFFDELFSGEGLEEAATSRAAGPSPLGLPKKPGISPPHSQSGSDSQSGFNSLAGNPALLKLLASHKGKD